MGNYSNGAQARFIALKGNPASETKNEFRGFGFSRGVRKRGIIAGGNTEVSGPGNVANPGPEKVWQREVEGRVLVAASVKT